MQSLFTIVALEQPRTATVDRWRSYVRVVTVSGHRRDRPHLVDTVLLASALGMLWVVRLWPWELLWLRAKIIGLVLYVALGLVALRGTPSAHGSSG